MPDPVPLTMSTKKQQSSAVEACWALTKKSSKKYWTPNRLLLYRGLSKFGLQASRVQVHSYNIHPNQVGTGDYHYNPEARSLILLVSGSGCIYPPYPGSGSKPASGNAS